MTAREKEYRRACRALDEAIAEAADYPGTISRDDINELRNEKETALRALYDEEHGSTKVPT